MSFSASNEGTAAPTGASTVAKTASPARSRPARLSFPSCDDRHLRSSSPIGQKIPAHQHRHGDRRAPSTFYSRPRQGPLRPACDYRRDHVQPDASVRPGIRDLYAADVNSSSWPPRELSRVPFPPMVSCARWAHRPRGGRFRPRLEEEASEDEEAFGQGAIGLRTGPPMVGASAASGTGVLAKRDVSRVDELCPAQRARART